MSNPKTVLLVRTRLPCPDETQISYRWAEVVKQSFEANGWRVTDIAADSAVRMYVESLLQTSEIAIFLFYGHGKPDRMIGQDGSTLIDLLNLSLLKDRRVYVVACGTAKVLGSEAEEIARFYLGYEDEVMIWLDPPYTECLEHCVNKGILAMLTSNCTIERARQHIINEYNHWIDHFAIGAGVSDPFSVDFAADLRYNRDALARVFGDVLATLTN